MDATLKADVYVICFDESLIKVTQEPQLDCYVHFFNNNIKQVMTWFITLSFLCHATADILKKAISENCKHLDLKKLLLILMDGPNVNLKLLQTLCSKRDSNYPLLMDKRMCGLHSAFRKAIKAYDFNIESLLSCLWWPLHDTPAQ